MLKKKGGHHRVLSTHTCGQLYEIWGTCMDRASSLFMITTMFTHVELKTHGNVVLFQST